MSAGEGVSVRGNIVRRHKEGTLHVRARGGICGLRYTCPRGEMYVNAKVGLHARADDMRVRDGVVCEYTRLGLHAREKVNFVPAEKGSSTREGGVRRHQARCTYARGTVFLGAGDAIGARIEGCTSARDAVYIRTRHDLSSRTVSIRVNSRRDERCAWAPGTVYLRPRKEVRGMKCVDRRNSFAENYLRAPGGRYTSARGTVCVGAGDDACQRERRVRCVPLFENIFFARFGSRQPLTSAHKCSRGCHYSCNLKLLFIGLFYF